MPSIVVSNFHLAIIANTAAQTHPMEPNTRISGKASGVLLVIAMEEVSPQVGMYAHMATSRQTNST